MEEKSISLMRIQKFALKENQWFFLKKETQKIGLMAIPGGSRNFAGPFAGRIGHPLHLHKWWTLRNCWQQVIQL